MFEQIKNIIKRDWKKIFIIFLILLVYYGFAIFMAWNVYMASFNNGHNSLAGMVLSSIRGLLENTIFTYILIYHAMIPLFHNRKFGRFFMIVLGILVVKIIVSFWLDYGLVHETYEISMRKTRQDNDSSMAFKYWVLENRKLFFLASLVIGYLLNLVVIFVVALVIDWNNRAKTQKELEKQKLDAELSAIKYQINPHFLFNSLNFIYSKTVPLSDEVSHAVLLLSDIMRYALGKEEDANGLVSLDRELLHMKNVIDINQMRFNNKLSILYNENITNHKARIVPLILITLVENAFKHGDLLNPNEPLVIQVDVDDSKLRFYICNKKKKGTKELSTGIGLKNVRHRLQLMYEKKHTLKVQEDDNFYITELTVNF
ncbi:histidine kinase [Chitinophaga skermanii]|uniref:Histidine kinase n=1 Tax=Chitinophaga skermanii TaxID=331697 RepID=A0A327R5U3_9BACT|nr:histidine kinase [Chitinophaga skermanii]RAJ11064.1 histidine kinase [Chitinophaga skermanii]